MTSDQTSPGQSYLWWDQTETASDQTQERSNHPLFRFWGHPDPVILSSEFQGVRSSKFNHKSIWPDTSSWAKILKINFKPIGYKISTDLGMIIAIYIPISK